MASKVNYGLKSVYYAIGTEDAAGNITYATPVAWPGAVSISLDAEGESSIFYADNSPYFQAIKNNGYSGDFESAMMPDSFRTGVMGETLDADGFYVEDASVQPGIFALLFQFEGDDDATRYALYRCKMTRPGIESSTTEDGIEVQTITAEITATPRLDDGLVKAVCKDKNATAYASWFTAVQEP